MLSLSYAATKLASVVIALSTLSPPPYGQPHLLHGLKAHWYEMGVFAQCELQFEVHKKLLEEFPLRQTIPSSLLKRRSLLTDDSDMTTALPSTIACICLTELTVLEVAVVQNYS
ncbi:hypothetical protein Tco_1455937, partial [Tanacetum coccineum]